MFRLSMPRCMRVAKPARRRTLMAVIAICVGVSFAAGCGSDDAPRDSKADVNEPISLRLGWAAAADPLLLTLISNGSLERNGLDVELVKFATGVAEVAALTRGDIDMGYMAAPPLVSLSAQDAGVSGIAISVSTSDANALVVPGDSDITEVADLKGKTVGTIVGSTLEFALDKMLEAAGLTPDDVKVINVAPQVHPVAFKSDDLDAIYTSQTPVLQLEASGARVLERESAVPDAAIAGLNYYVARDAFLSENPEAAQRFFAALQETAAKLAEDPGLGVAQLVEIVGVTEEQAQKLSDLVKVVPLEQQVDPGYAFNLNGGIQEAVEPVIESMAALGQIKAEVPGSQLFDAQPLIEFTGGSR